MPVYPKSRINPCDRNRNRRWPEGCRCRWYQLRSPSVTFERQPALCGAGKSMASGQVWFCGSWTTHLKIPAKRKGFFSNTESRSVSASGSSRQA